MPYLGNIFYNLGVGALTLKDSLLNNFVPIKINPNIFIGITIFDSFILILILSLIFKNISIFVKARDKKAYLRNNETLFFLLIFYIVFVSGLLVFDNIFDRYILILFIPFLLLINQLFYRNNFHKFISFGSIILIVGLFIFSLCGLQNYFNWNNARWNAISILEKEYKANSNNIDGGYEYNGYNNYDKKIVNNNRSWYWVIDDKYLVSFSKFENYRVLGSVSYCQYFGLINKEILILERNE
jgi:membrane-associated HD superfamily phosphohydrolase